MYVFPTDRILLEVRNLGVQFSGITGEVQAIRFVELAVEENKVLGIVGESGSGKTLTALSILRLLPPNAKITSGSIKFKSKELLTLSEKEMQSIRGRQIAMIFQEPAAAFDPLYTIGEQLLETIQHNNKHISKKEAYKYAHELLALVKVPHVKERFNNYPHQLSGGLLQRAMLAIALASSPNLLIADELTTALDVVLQVQILNLLEELKEIMKLTIIIISHDINVVAYLSDKLAVMYKGDLVEYGDAQDILNTPAHPYTSLLLLSASLSKERKVRSNIAEERIDRNPFISSDLNKSCKFIRYCKEATALCSQERPPLVETEIDHFVACFKR